MKLNDLYYYLLGGGSSAPFTPLTLSGCTLWLDADNSGSITQSGGFVSQWDDLSTTGASFTQGTGNLQPAYIASGIGGKPTLSFSGATSAKSYMTDTGTNQFLGDGTSPFTLWIVLEPGTAASFIVFADFLGAGSGNHPEFGFTTADVNYKNIYFAANSGSAFGRAKTETAFGDPDVPYMITVTFDGAGTYNIYDSNVAQTVAAAANAAGSITNTTIGGYAPGGGVDPVRYFSELVIYNRVLTSTERGQLQTYGNAKYGI